MSEYAIILCRLVSFTNGVVGSICSIIVVWQAREDVLLSK